MPKDTFFNLSEEKRQRIIDAAVLEFSKSHYNKVTIDGIVGCAEIPKGSFYQYFENKDDLYTYTFSQIGDRKKDTLEKTEQYIDTLTFREYLLKMLEDATEFEDEDLVLIQLKDKFMNECPQEVRRKVLKNEIPKSYRLLEKVLTAYIQKGELKEDLDVKVAAYIITTCIVNLENFEFDENENMHDVVIRIFNVLMGNLSK
ncbi:TetR/AcrR family transcriptional regulator [Vallitalea pronyensis]|uniref:TetR/AcrR family transcriptional regulator n=1 Tax=Vallitalea pronyensis TaxID=1348613 RepID=A0A8J8MNT8_9FIRM|nr:TetR/AcrR family transcriptional regulator [Vallitalea pronyensis]QUI25155.1 TetR/AcrR family transcriptional regulator [Vallitalea pronyensis]